MIVRDQYGIICQHNRDYPDYLDQGDSAARTGLMAMCESPQDLHNITEFLTFGKDGLKLVRHPHQLKWNDSALTSRDQLIQWAAGTRGAELACYWIARTYATSWFINKDFLAPDVRLYLYKCAEGCGPWEASTHHPYVSNKAPFYIKLLGYPLMFLSILWSCYATPNEEQNKMIAMCSIYGRNWLRLLVRLHPSIVNNLNTYWGGHPWRDQPEIAEALINYINKELLK